MDGREEQTSLGHDRKTGPREDADGVGERRSGMENAKETQVGSRVYTGAMEKEVRKGGRMRKLRQRCEDGAGCVGRDRHESPES